MPLACDHAEPALDIRRHRDEPRHRGELPARTPLLPSPRRRRHAGALAVEVRVEQAVQRDDALVVRRRLRDEVHDDAGLLARVDPHDPSDPLLVHALAGGRREVHADGRAG